jgi:hypothetical protein
VEIAIAAFCVAVAVGVVLRGARARRRRVRVGLEPVADAADAYQALLLGRPDARVSYGSDGPTATSLIVSRSSDDLLPNEAHHRRTPRSTW